MNKEQGFYHSLDIDGEKCIGCSHCMKICPTEAIRIRDGKAHLDAGRCIDCGVCFSECPMKAIYSPMPAPMAFLSVAGILFTMASRMLKNVSSRKMIPSINMAVIAHCQE